MGIRRLLLVAVLAMAPWTVNAQMAVLPQITLQAGLQLIHAEVASNDADRERGLMFRRELDGNNGMLFIFDMDQSVCMWMKNTFIPLSVAFIDDSGRITNIEDMRPQTLDSHCGVQKVRFALEMPMGWFAKRGIKPGFKLRGEPFGPAGAH